MTGEKHPHEEDTVHKKLLAGAAAGFIAAVGFAAPASAISESTADLYVLHAVPDATVDVWVNGEVLIEDFEPGTLTPAYDLPAGDYEVAITAPDQPIDTAIIGPATFSLAANTSYTVVAHLDEAGAPTATAFVNDLSTIPAGQGKLTVRHTAAAPAVDVLANGAPAFEGLTNPQEVKADLPVGTIAAAVALAGTTDPVIGPADVTIQEGVNTIVYAWGSAADDNLALAVQTIGGLHSNPDGVNTGQAGLVADPDPTLITWAIAGLIVVLAAAGFSIARIRAVKSENR